MTQDRADSGTILLEQDGAEVGVIKKVYSPKLARLELQNSESIAMDPSLVTNITSTGRILKKKQATILPETKSFFVGASERLNKLTQKGLRILVKQMTTKEVKKALQQFEFNLLVKADYTQKLPLYEVLGLIRGIELAGKTAQDVIIKEVFKVCEVYPELKERIAPEIVVDRLNQEKAFYRILWNFARIGVSQAAKLKDQKAMDAAIDAILEIGLKHIEIEMKTASSTTDDILYWQKRIENCIIKYFALLILSLEAAEQEEYLSAKKAELTEKIKDIRIQSSLREQAQKLVSNLSVESYEKAKETELIHSGIRGFNLKVMTEKKVMKALMKKVNQFINTDYKEGKGVATLHKELDTFFREARDVSRDFSNLLFEINQFLKKIEYGDSKVREYYSELVSKANRRKYYDLINVLNRLLKVFVEKKN